MENQLHSESKISAPIITLAEAASISGMSESEINSLIKHGQIKGKMIGSSWRVYRMSLLAHITKKAPVAAAAVVESETKTNESRIGATAAIENTQSDEIWALRQALEKERDGHAFEKTLHEATKVQLASAHEKIERLSSEIETLKLQLAGSSAVASPKKTGFFEMIRRAFLW